MNISRVFATACLVLVFQSAAFAGSHAPPDSVPPAVITIPLADTSVEFHWHRPGHSRVLFLVIHDDENTSSEVGYNAMWTYGATLVEMKNDNKYLFTLLRDSVGYFFNPNRIFSLNGIESTLSRFGPCNDTVVGAIALFASQVAGAFLDEAECIVALHNNQNNGFSVKSYVTDSTLMKAVDSLFINPAMDPDDFYYVVDPAHFVCLKEKGFNVVLQTSAHQEDDGSLSFWCARRGIPYINIEAEQGHGAIQRTMLDVFISLIINK